MNNYLRVLNPKRPKVQKENPFSIEQRNDFDFMYKQIQENGYSYYQYASPILKRDNKFVWTVAYSCLSKVNSMEDKFLARKMLKSFLEYVERESGYKLEWAIEEGLFRVKIKDKSDRTIAVVRDISNTTNLLMYTMFNRPKVKTIKPRRFKINKKTYEDIYDRAA